MTSRLAQFLSENRLALLLGTLLTGFLLGSIFLLYRFGTSHGWSSVEGGESLGAIGPIDRAGVSGDGSWLYWTIDEHRLMCAYHLRNPGSVKVFRTPAHLAIRPVAVVGERIFLLRTTMDRGFFEQLAIGLKRLMGVEEIEETEEAGFRPLGWTRTTYLEGIDLDSGRPASRIKGATHRVLDPDPLPTGFEMGRVETSPDQESIAWWWALEQAHETPVSATVVETFESYRIGDAFELKARKELTTPGTFRLWSEILQQVGSPFWLDPRTCLFLSFLDGGSLVPVDTHVGDFAATMALEEMFLGRETGGSVKRKPPILPEGVCSVPNSASRTSSLLFWGRDAERVQFLEFGSDFILSSTITYPIGNLDLSDPMWISGGRLLLRERESRDYVALSGLIKKTEKFPPAPFTEEEFAVLGCDFNGGLIALFDSKFWVAASDDEAWSELVFSP